MPEKSLRVELEPRRDHGSNTAYQTVFVYRGNELTRQLNYPRDATPFDIAAHLREEVLLQERLWDEHKDEKALAERELLLNIMNSILGS
jgi:hypothetical protein